MKKAFFELDRFFGEESSVTPVVSAETSRLTHLERDRWPEFEQELRARRLRSIRFMTSSFENERLSWEWLIWRCRTWEEVGRVLNKHNVSSERLDRGAIEAAGVIIYRQ
jgi:hypothetical protein